ncbi:hypothetical protein [Brevibacillus borstelensis]|uniref:hypothetical protein n=1 Tax=Brevibacillus borstelensis TaxID=45462 RepID=UPI0004683CD8|nr:hypothetical protein [Brevibacillus borstelensis]
MAARKRRYYREERRLAPVVLDADMYDDADDEEFDRETDRIVRKASWTIAAVLAVGTLLSLTPTWYTPIGGEAYRVVSVSKGRVHTEDVTTGERVSFPDQQLVKAALSGKIKRGDVIYR